MPKIINVWDYPKGLEVAARYIHSIWGNQTNYAFYYDAMAHSSPDASSLPCFFLMLEGDAIIGCYALIINDFVSRHDLYPWLACLYVDKSRRGKALGEKLLAHGRQTAAAMGFKTVFLTTDHEGYYEKYGWERCEDAFDPHGERGRVYKFSL